MPRSTRSSGAHTRLDLAHSQQRVVGEVRTPTFTVQEKVYAEGLCVARHAHGTAGLIYVLSGHHWSAFASRGEHCPPHTVRFVPEGEPHENYFPQGSRCLQAELSPEVLQTAAECGRVVRAPGELPGPRAAALGARWRAAFCQGDEGARLDVEATVLELLLVEDGRDPSRERRVPAWIGSVREMLREHACDRVTLADVSRIADRHPVHVSRQFRRHFGCTIGQYIRRVRVATAQSLLMRGELTISEVALTCGFADQSHFTAAFRSLTGVPPLRYRTRMRNA